MVPSVTDDQKSDFRKHLHALIDLLDDQELPHVLIPLSYASRLAKKRP